MKKIAIIGAGNVGGQAAFFCAQKKLGRVLLIDIKEGLAKGKALDQNQALYLMGINPLITGSEDISSLEGSDVILITCGVARKPGMTREQLLKINLSIVRDISHVVKRLSPQSIVLMMTNPVDILSYACMKFTGFPRERVIGQAGVLDSARFATYISQRLDLSSADIDAVVLGGHGDTMVPVPEFTTVSGIPLPQMVSSEDLDGLVKRTRNGGAEIISYLKDSSAYYAPSLSAVLMIEAVLKNEKRLFPCSVYVDGEYGMKGVFIGLPVVLSEKGVERVICIDLPEERRDDLKRSFDFYRGEIEKIQSEVEA
ncbi:MAG: malate dehydrogenase [Candidatus Aureabacteria bacterium]|nr:malate dehydrogenase [Candidatus Auribacterota bacterium]